MFYRQSFPRVRRTTPRCFSLELSLGAILGPTLVLSLGACTSLSGLDAKKEFACPAPVGVLCEDMSQIYARTQNGTLPSQLARAEQSQKQQNQKRALPERSGAPPTISSNTPTTSGAAVATTKPPYSGMPIRSTPKVLRVWINAWVDAEGDLHDQSFLYVMVSQGAWQVDHNRRRIMDTYGPVQAPEKRSPLKPTATPNAGPGVRGPNGEMSSVVGSYRDQALSGATMITPGMVLPGGEAAPEGVAQ